MRRNQSNLFYRGTVEQEGHMSPASFHFSSFHQPQQIKSQAITLMLLHQFKKLRLL